MIERKVRTLGGAKKFGRPIGSVIDRKAEGLLSTSQVGSPEGSSSGGVVRRADTSPGQASMIRLRSLRRQILVARRLGNDSRADDLQGDFAREMDEYRASADNKRMSTTLSRVLAGVR